MWRQLHITFFSLIAAVFVAACEESLDSQAKKVTAFFEKNRYGSSPDYAVVKNNMFGQREHLIVVYGFMNDYEICQKIVAKLNIEEPNAYHCEQLNLAK